MSFSRENFRALVVSFLSLSVLVFFSISSVLAMPGESASRNSENKNSGNRSTQESQEAAQSTGPASSQSIVVEPKEIDSSNSSKNMKKENKNISLNLIESENEANNHWQLAHVYMGLGDFDLAQLELELAVMNKPNLQVAHRDLCFVSALRMDFARCLAEFMMTVGLGESIPLNEDEQSKLIEKASIMHYNKGLKYAQKSDWKQTIFEMEWAARLFEDDPLIERSLAFAYANIGDFVRAEKHYKKTFELSPDDGSSRADLAYLLASKGKLKEAQAQMTEAVKSQPEAPAYHVDLAWVAESRKDLNVASKEIEAALKLSPKHSYLWSHLGRLQEELGDDVKALSSFEQALALDANNFEAKGQICKLKQKKSSVQNGINNAAHDLSKVSSSEKIQ